ncbi:DUF4097 family beta strand repeat-containing protein [Actinomadura rubrisoli]|uniref:DUF4097 domain-containing protein n=1 Tax=Actinomadura rubrisoli TaxID=2530368 RepID=A0A4R5C895_9ACTN|nr:DUF4097 family beta strand repeat-containing protein [Actinomadura rubrisoli]TDD94836.1 hypothetical protein E1298_06190 [Actinomadura rubrisoli]
MTKVQARRSADQRQRRVWTAAGVTLIALAAAGVLVGMRSWPHNWKTHYQTQRQTFRHPVRQLALDLSTGDIALTPGAPGVLQVQRKIKWSGSLPVFDERWNGDTFHVGDRCPSDAECSITYAVALPPDVTVTARTREGDITVHNLSGALAMNTSAGDISGTGLAGAQITAATGAGNVQLAFGRAPARVEAVSTAGQVDVNVPRGQSYLVQTGAKEGGTSVQVPQSPSAGHLIIARSSAGDVRVGYSN